MGTWESVKDTPTIKQQKAFSGPNIDWNGYATIINILPMKVMSNTISSNNRITKVLA